MSRSLLAKFTSGHLSRWLIALLLLPPILKMIFWENTLVFLGLIVIIGSVVWWEYFVNLLGRERKGIFIISLLGWLAIAFGARFFGPHGQQVGILISLFLGAVYTLALLPTLSGSILLNLLSRYALGHLYISFGLSFLILLRQEANGAKWILYILLLNIVADTAAFYVGQRFKGPKLYIPASPNKTISGLMGGVLGGAIISAISVFYLSTNASWLVMALVGGVFTLIAAFGDLFESSLKRTLGIKDSSQILLGHGGLWDRLDGIIFTAAPVYFFVFFYIGV